MLATVLSWICISADRVIRPACEQLADYFDPAPNRDVYIR